MHSQSIYQPNGGKIEGAPIAQQPWFINGWARSLTESNWVIVIQSDDYFDSENCAAEWNAITRMQYAMGLNTVVMSQDAINYCGDGHDVSRWSAHNDEALV